ncbi:hypothetical protein MMC24_006687 [Lignoscripta atroalba]|nr:hypothetical protein [Lignoscripta atroalba]
MASASVGLEVLLVPLLFTFVLTPIAFFWRDFILSQLRPLSDIPGPRWAAFSRLWLVKTLASGDSAVRFVEVNSQYGRLARIGPNHLLTNDPELTRRILATTSRYTRAPWFDSLKIDPHVSNIASERDAKKHSRLRYKLSAGYAGQGIDDVEPTIDEHILNWIRCIDAHCLAQRRSSRAFDIGKSIQFLTVDLITQLCLGEAFGCVDSNRDQFDFLATVRTGSAISQHFSVLLEVNRLLFYLTKIPFLRRLLVPSVKDKTGVGKIMGVIRNTVEHRFGPDKPLRKDMLGSFLERGLSLDNIETELIISLVAGSDTTSTSVQATLFAIISDPRVYKKLQLEIDAAVSQGKVSSPIRDNEARQHPYLQACILEGLRKHPPVSQLRERMVPPEGDEIDGYRIPGGTYIGLNTWGTQLNEVFGDDPVNFRPERWLIEDQERLQAMRRTQDLVFGHGSTKCLGVRIANMELNKIFFELLRRFDIATSNPIKPWKSTCYGIFFQEDFNVRIVRRE